mmetsp:Transcript_108729/g.306403  ORF Transcript_108729/g.306403 Transcript_108729/m.306403 type:complete len:209 (+) Transcript_108729:334-960(+)
MLPTGSSCDPRPSNCCPWALGAVVVLGSVLRSGDMCACAYRPLPPACWTPPQPAPPPPRSQLLARTIGAACMTVGAWRLWGLPCRNTMLYCGEGFVAKAAGTSVARCPASLCRIGTVATRAPVNSPRIASRITGEGALLPRVLAASSALLASSTCARTSESDAERSPWDGGTETLPPKLDIWSSKVGPPVQEEAVSPPPRLLSPGRSK